MIGLGSNRLTVCRRGGMSVTQVGRGGMEWLAGGRGPSWSSPYSAQATAALKAQFSLEQWAIIKTYGFAHPEIVGYMNAYAPEDAKIAYSLVEGIGTRWLCGGTAYINSGFSGFVWTQDTIEAKCYALEYPSTIAPLLGCRNSAGDNLIYWATPQNDSVRHGNFYTSSGQDDISNIQCIIPTTWKFSKRNIYYNGVLQATTPYSKTGQNSILIFRSRDSSGGVESRIPKGAFAFVKIWDNDVIAREMYPFKRNGALGMIDVLTGTFYPNVNATGTFTELIESPS